jgi:NAD+ kinase
MTKIKYIKSTDKRSTQFDNFISKNYPKFLTEEHPDLILVTGGDGAMLHAIQDHYKYDAPFFGRAAGSLNFLMNTIKNDKEVIATILKSTKKLNIIETTSIRVDVTNNEKIQNLGFAVNDVVIGSDIMGYHKYNVTSADGSFDDFELHGTGLCISTDLGSTGYNFNLGGPILPLGSGFWALEGIACNRHLNDILAIEKLRIQCSPAHGPAGVFIDGINRHILESDQTVILSKGHKIRIVFLDKADFIKRRIEITSRLRKS